MAEENAVGLARLAGLLRAEAANGLYWGGEEEELLRLRLLRRLAAALTAEVDHRPLAEIESIFEADEHLRSPMPGTEFRIRCAGGDTLVHRRRLRRGGESLDRRLAEFAESLETEVPSGPSDIADTDSAGLPCPHTFLLVYEASTPLTAAEASRRLPPGDPDLEGPPAPSAPTAGDCARRPAPLPVSPAAKRILAEVARLGTEGLAAAPTVYERERHERLLGLCSGVVQSELAYTPLDCGDLAAECVSTGADAAVFDDRDRLLLIRRTDTGQWAMPGGAAEVGETVAASAVREALEETGLNVSVTGLVCAFDKRDHGVGDSRLPMILTFSARLDDPGQPVRLAELEASDHRWITRDEIGGIDFFRGHELRVPAAFDARGGAGPL